MLCPFTFKIKNGTIIINMGMAKVNKGDVKLYVLKTCKNKILLFKNCNHEKSI